MKYPEPDRSRWTALGLMSGTSMDGVDAALAELEYIGDRVSVRLIAAHTIGYPPEILESLRNIGSLDVDEIARLNFDIGEVFAAAARDVIEHSGMTPAQIDVIGSHGQTVSHQPRSTGGAGATLQLGEPAVIAERTGIVTVADFRVNDVAAGGDGAPLVPYVDWLLFARADRTVAAQNIGGIANVTVVTDRLDDVIAFDTGPGNMLIDLAVLTETSGETGFDRDGKLAARGNVHTPLLDRLLAHPYLALAPPKSTGTAEFGAGLVAELRRQFPSLSTEGFVATLTEFTARSIADAYHRFVFPRFSIDEIVLSGGGARNPWLRRRIEQMFKPVPVTTSDIYGIDPDAKEAVAFAMLAVETMLLRPGNVPQATGAHRPVILGKIIPCICNDSS